ncbi:MAG: glycosyltransferase [Gemmatimonadetes bacterium]|nr:glycosyltransferase [Gemmatimonadota bacterium]
MPSEPFLPTAPSLSIVIPVYKSEAVLRTTVTELLAFFDGREQFEVILVNDGSPDDVESVMRELAALDPRVRVIALGGNIGQHRATLVGFFACRGAWVVTLDDDGQNPPEAAQLTLAAARQGRHDVVYGRFETTEQSWQRRVASTLNRWLSQYTIGNVHHVAISNVRAVRGELARAIGGVETPYPYIDALVFRMTNRVADVPVPHRPRTTGASNYSFSGLLRLWLSHLTSLSVLPLQFAMIGSFGVSAIGFAIGSFYLVRSVTRGGTPLGWLSLFVTLTFLFSVLFAFLGIISAYLGRTYVSLNERGLVWQRAARTGAPDGSPEEQPRP